MNLTVLLKKSSRYPADKKTIKKSVADTLLKNGIVGNVEVSVSVVGARKMLDLSRKYLKDDSLHEVLAFGQEEFFSAGKDMVWQPDRILRPGDVILCWPEVLKCAARDNIMVNREVYLLTSHAVLHLLGKHHE